MENAHIEDIVRLGRRIPMGDAIGRMASIIHIATPDRTIEARDSTTTSSSADSTSTCGASACEKPVGDSTFTLPIILGIAIPVIGAAILFIVLQRRHVRRQRAEDANDRHASMDFGLGDVPKPARAAKRAPTGMSEMSYGEKGGVGGMSRRQVSMDMGMASPYLLPPELQNSRESLHSLSRTIHQQEDPYRPVSQYYPNDAASIRSKSKQGSSIYTGSSGPSKLQEMSSANLLANAGQMPRSHPPSGDFKPPPRQNSLPQSNASMSPISPVESIPPPYPAQPPQAYMPGLMTPSSPESQQRHLPASPRPGQNSPPAPRPVQPQDVRASNGNGNNVRQSNDYLAGMIMDKETAPPAPLERKAPPPAINTLPTNPRPARKESMPQGPMPVDDQDDYGDGFKVTPPSPGREQMRGQRYSMDVPPEQFAQAGLGAPGFDPKRLSMGFRPLPPDAVTESDDPEIRANRIRSFYKEYFDESKPAPQGQYYEDYDENYLGDAAYFDPETNAFVMPGAMPFAEPITRRAMTPPPMGPPRFPGPPRGRQGSMGAMSAGGMRGPPPGPRAYSSASGRMARPGPKRPLPPPTPLNSLPTPSKLRDDSFALMGSIEFAPPQTYRDRVAGRSESPFGERRPYSPAVPAFAPVVSAFDELAPIPSPHMLRKSGTFTSLDFAPPKKFRDPDSMSDAGSIRSNRSGISTTQLGAIRNGAYRISRIPKDVVFTKDDLATTLKPQWGMRAE
ncbi:uncharacterized protein PAC_02920 [Phialocephala subalpina]|uniref:Uncharacterized protein n=1 Tax=Phialocephala subalpina TaxID=576137 RepID=A0A1L7WJT8_9HELO|nr:uncharacterized protein PAC_02920 [Phialocephala subalpina]